MNIYRILFNLGQLKWSGYYILQTRTRAKYSVHCSSFWCSENTISNYLTKYLTVNINCTTIKAEHTPLVTLHYINCPCLSHSFKNSATLCVYHVVVARTYADGNVLSPQHPSFISPAARLNATAFISCAITCLNQF